MLPKKLEEHLRLTLSNLPTPFSQLAFLASVRDPYTGRYLHEGWYSLASPEEVHQVLRRVHEDTFESVIELRLVEMSSELRRYFDAVCQPENPTARLWLDLEPYREMIPQGCSQLERSLFLSQVKAALTILLIAPRWPLLREQDAWQSQPPAPRFRPHLDN